MLDLSPIANAIKTLQQPPPQVMPLVAKAMKPVRDAETLAAVPPPVKSGRSGLGEHMDLYDTHAEAFTALSAEETVPEAPPPIDLPFLKPLGPVLGKAIDARVWFRGTIGVMPRDDLKSRLFRLSGPGPYRALHAAGFPGRPLRARLSRKCAARFFGRDALAFAGILRPGNLVPDIGAYLGGSTALFTDAVGPTGRIMAFESVHHRFLGLLIRFRCVRRAKVEPPARAGRNGWAERVIPIRRGIPLYSQSVPAVKIDVEGSETGLFAGREGFFGRFRGPVLCEFRFREMPPPGRVWLRERGYSCRYLGGTANGRP